MRRIVVGLVGLVVALAWSVYVEAQPRTNPPSLDFTCHGYDEGTTRAYNCIPESSQQPLMQTFVPPVGSACNAGSIITTSDVPDRIVFQIRCQEEGGTPPPTVDNIYDFEIVNLRRRATSSAKADWIHLLIRPHRESNNNYLYLEFLFDHGGFYSTCGHYHWPVLGSDEAVAINPAGCEHDEQWSSVTIQMADTGTTFTCGGCGTFARTAIPPTSRPLVPDSIDPLGAALLLEEFEYQVQKAVVGK